MKTLIAILAVCALLALSPRGRLGIPTWILGLVTETDGSADEELAESTGHDDPHEKQDESHEPGHVKVDRETQEQIGLKWVRLRAARLLPEIKALGTVEEHPARSFTVRAAVAGYLRVEENEWPSIGAILNPQTVLGAVQPRITPLEQFGLTGQFVEADAAVAEIEAELSTARASYESKRTLNTEGKMVSDRQVEEAESKVKAGEARLAGALRKRELLESQRAVAAQGLEPVPVVIDGGGEVVEVTAMPGEVVESGQPLLRVARLDRLMARIELPLGESWNSPESGARLGLVVDEEHVWPAKTVALAPRAGSLLRGQTWLLEVEDQRGGLRPGMPVIAYLPRGGEALTGAMVPASAIVRYAGLTWVYVKVNEETFERREVTLGSPTPQGWFVTAGVSAEETVVETGAQVLLSEQLKGQIEAEAEAEE